MTSQGYINNGPDSPELKALAELLTESSEDRSEREADEMAKMAKMERFLDATERDFLPPTHDPITLDARKNHCLVTSQLYVAAGHLLYTLSGELEDPIEALALDSISRKVGRAGASNLRAMGVPEDLWMTSTEAHNLLQEVWDYKCTPVENEEEESETQV